MSIRDCLEADHRHCDDLFAEAEQAANRKDWAAARQVFASFCQAMVRHFAVEEQTLFPAFEERTGMRMGPTQMMRLEHEQMRELMNDAVNALQQQNSEDFLGQLETLLIMMQQHNLKEENILYPMCDTQLADCSAALVDSLRAGLAGA